MPYLRVDNRGAWLRKMAMSPVSPGAITISASPSQTMRSCETISQRTGIFSLTFRRHTFGLLGGFLDGAYHHECLLGQVIVLAIQDLPETANCLTQGDVATLAAGELFGDEERLREKAFDLTGPRHDQLIVFAELIDAQDGDDILEILVALQHLLDL